jgi:glutamate/tyrosine decarboxylase-like PLP-dependent enzyme
VPAREQYQRMATRCLRAAERLHDPAERLKLLQVVGGYMALARHVADRHDHGTAHRGSEYRAEHRRDDA